MGSIEDLGYVTKIDVRHVYLGIVYENGKGVNTIYYPRDLIVKYKY